MVIETSALVAIVLGEPEETRFLEAMYAAPLRLISAVGLVEAASVLMNRGKPSIEYDLDRLIERAGVMVVPVDEEQAMLARTAYRTFGKGRHRAGLNLGDCFSYALSIRTGEPLLFKGNDFIWTDVVKAKY